LLLISFEPEQETVRMLRMDEPVEREERRKLKRLEISLPVHVHLLNEKNVVVSKKETDGVLYDFSAGGCAFSHKDKIPIGDRLQLRIELDEELSRKYSMKELTVRGAVLHCTKDEDGWVIGVKFSIDR
jgi:c-di-GMP-binding flagellar brake protein YcgR